MKRDFVEALKGAEGAREGATLRQGAAHRISQQIQEGRGSRRKAARRRTLAIVLAPVMAAAAALLVLVLKPASPEVGGGAPLQVAESVGSQTVLPAGSRAVAQQQRLEVVSEQGAVLEREAVGVRMVEGVARFSVQRRAPGEPEVVVQVSHGRIEVLGTEFTVTQRSDGGEVTLHEGSIRFRAEGGAEVLLSPGETLRWPLPVVAERAPLPLPIEDEPSPEQAPVPETGPETVPETGPERPQVVQRRAPRQPAPAFDVGAVIESVEVFRRQGRFEEAAGELEKALRRSLPDATAERLSYELGDILTWQLRDKEAACAVWAEHRARHGSESRYAQEIARAERTLGCGR